MVQVNSQHVVEHVRPPRCVCCVHCVYTTVGQERLIHQIYENQEKNRLAGEVFLLMVGQPSKHEYMRKNGLGVP